MSQVQKREQIIKKEKTVFGVQASEVMKSSIILTNKSVKQSDLKIFELAGDNSSKIRELDKKEFNDKLAKRVLFWKDDLGIVNETTNREVFAYKMSRLSQYLQRHYSDFTLSEIKEAFELFIAEKLYVGDGKGNRLQHYQSFDLSFISKILNAYRKERGIVCSKIIGLLPEEEVSKEEIEKKNQDFVQFFYDFYSDVIRSQKEEDFTIKRHRFFKGFTDLLIRNDLFNPTQEQEIRAEKLTFVQMRKDLQELKEIKAKAYPHINDKIRALKIGEIHQEDHDKFKALKDKILLKIFLEDSARADIVFKDLKFNTNE